MAEVTLFEKVSIIFKDRIFKRIDWQLILVLFAFVVIVLFLRAPNAWMTTGTQEGWNFLYTVGHGRFIPDPNGMLAPRPLILLPWAISYELSHNSFAGVQIVLALFWWAKAALLFLIFRQLKLGTVTFAFLAATLAIVYPADRASFAEFALSRHAAVVLYFLSVWFLTLSAEKDGSKYQIPMLLTLLASCLVSEQGILLILSTPVLLFALGTSRRQKIRIILSWYSVVFVYLVFFIITTLRLNEISYQVKIFEGGVTGNSSLIVDVIKSMVVAYKRGFWTGWLDIFEYMHIQLLSILLPALAIAVITIVVGVVLSRNKSGTLGMMVDPKRLLFLAVAGLSIYGFGFSPYTFTQFRYDPYRVFFFSTAGSAITVLAIVLLFVYSFFRKKQEQVLVIVSSFIVLLASMNTINSNAIWVNRSRLQQRLIVSMAEQAPYIEPQSSAAVIIDTRDSSPFVSLGLFTNAVRWLYPDKQTKGFMCYLDLGNCIFTSTGVILNDPEDARFNGEHSYEMILLFRYVPETGVILLDSVPAELMSESTTIQYNPYGRIDAYTPFPERLLNAFEPEYLPNSSRVAPNSWHGKNVTMNDRRVCDENYSGDCSLLIDGKADAGFDQTMYLDGNLEDVVEMRLCARSNDDEFVASGQGTIATLTVINVDGSFDDYPLSVDDLTRKWNCYVSSNKVTKPYSSITIRLENPSVSSQIWVDALGLYVNGVSIYVENSSFEY